jgi:hypothetical protein
MRNPILRSAAWYSLEVYQDKSSVELAYHMRASFGLTLLLTLREYSSWDGIFEIQTWASQKSIKGATALSLPSTTAIIQSNEKLGDLEIWRREMGGLKEPGVAIFELYTLTFPSLPPLFLLPIRNSTADFFPLPILTATLHVFCSCPSFLALKNLA